MRLLSFALYYVSAFAAGGAAIGGWICLATGLYLEVVGYHEESTSTLLVATFLMATAAYIRPSGGPPPQHSKELDVPD